MRSRRKSGKKQKSVFLIALSMVLFIIMCSACFGTIRAQAADETSAYKYYTSIQITPGQTLNDIAGIYMTDDYKDTSAYIEEVCMINHIFPDDIHEGEYLTVPYYSAEYLKQVPKQQRKTATKQQQNSRNKTVVCGDVVFFFKISYNNYIRHKNIPMEVVIFRVYARYGGQR